MESSAKGSATSGDAAEKEEINFELIAESTDLVDLAYQPICRVDAD